MKTALSLVLLAAIGCAEGAETPEFSDQPEASTPWTPPPSSGVDSGTWSNDTWTPPASYDSSVSPQADASGGYDASWTPDSGAVDAATKPDASDLLGGLGGLFGGSPDAGKPLDPGSKPAEGAGPGNPAGWKLDPGSAKECPAVPPPIPVLGGICVGIYWTCNWTNAQGQKYFCTCDWIHYLCI